MSDELQVYPIAPTPTKFLIIGLISSIYFQKCRYLVDKLHGSYPKLYAPPEIRQMLNVDWQEYIIKMRREFGRPFYLLKKPVAVFIDGEFLGDDSALWNVLKKQYLFEISLNFEDMATAELLKYLNELIDVKKRQLVYFTVTIDDRVAGSLLFMLYNDLVPNTCKNFVNRITSEDCTYKNTLIHRIVQNSWLQCGGQALIQKSQPCENYVIPHNRRGVLSMCNAYKHADNTTQFFITLDSTPWMDYKYVAFGQLLQGAELLTILETIPSYYQTPQNKIVISDCGLFELMQEPPAVYAEAVNVIDRIGSDMDVDVPTGVDLADSTVDLNAFNAGRYFHKKDRKAYYPFEQYSRMFDPKPDESVILQNYIFDGENWRDDYLPVDQDVIDIKESQPSLSFFKLPTKSIMDMGIFFDGSHVFI